MPRTTGVDPWWTLFARLNRPSFPVGWLSLEGGTAVESPAEGPDTRVMNWFRPPGLTGRFSCSLVTLAIEEVETFW